MNKNTLIHNCLNHKHLDHKNLKSNSIYSWNYCNTCWLIFNTIINKKHKVFKNKLKIFDKFIKSNINEEFKSIYKKIILLTNLKNKKWLDFGCGTGNELEYLKKKKINCFGFEPNKKLYQKCRKKKLMVSNNIKNLGKHFDIIFTRNTFKYVDNFPKNISILSNLLKQKGLFVWRDKYFDFMPIHKSMNNFNESMVTSTFLRKDSIKNYLDLLNFEIILSKFYLDESFFIIAKKKIKPKKKFYKNYNLNKSNLLIYKHNVLLNIISIFRLALFNLYILSRSIKNSLF